MRRIEHGTLRTLYSENSSRVRPRRPLGIQTDLAASLRREAMEGGHLLAIDIDGCQFALRHYTHLVRLAGGLFDGVAFCQPTGNIQW